ncbi:hypothetical protein Y032_0003g1276 [Ancylostoma ceylanicum]|uniref:Uncharacterized protein n=1 Tax=Ancylostoma ceylanicum TaxID=53326 RepID=A0A016VYL2_9BILA|nr:hypothetical protein Y032_0003g1276 [Ancylostoma ceylanicum]
MTYVCRSIACVAVFPELSKEKQQNMFVVNDDFFCHNRNGMKIWQCAKVSGRKLSRQPNRRAKLSRNTKLYIVRMSPRGRDLSPQICVAAADLRYGKILIDAISADKYRHCPPRVIRGHGAGLSMLNVVFTLLLCYPRRFENEIFLCLLLHCYGFTGRYRWCYYLLKLS